MKQMDADGRVYFPADKSKRLRRKRFLDELKGENVDSLWDDIPPVNSMAQERLGYPTQKPVALLERIIQASSNEGDVLLDPFCGCGTSIHAAQNLNRQWIGIDITHLAIRLIETRLEAFSGLKYRTHGVPKDLEGARDLATRDKHEFQLWATAQVEAVPYRNGQKGADGGVDGVISLRPNQRTNEVAIVSVKGGHNVGVHMVRELAHVVKRDRAQVGILITLTEPTGPMKAEAVKEGFYETVFGKHPRLQIITVAELFEGKMPNLPPRDSSIFRKPPKVATGKQTSAWYWRGVVRQGPFVLPKCYAQRFHFNSFVSFKPISQFRSQSRYRSASCLFEAARVPRKGTRGVQSASEV
jgi:site-specific DNA-methyltransferase (adenine-specific)